MIKRMTLLARKDGSSTSDFRNYWAGPHAKLALGMDGIAKYVHNRVDKLLWVSDIDPSFSVDGIVELYFSDEEAMRSAQASDVGRRYIPEDEPVFLKGWTLCVVDADGEGPDDRATKVIVPFHLAAGSGRDRVSEVLKHAAAASGAGLSMNHTVSTARRERLWTEPHPPGGFAIFRFKSVAEAHRGFDHEGVIRTALSSAVSQAAAYLVDELTIR